MCPDEDARVIFIVVQLINNYKMNLNLNAGLQNAHTCSPLQLCLWRPVSIAKLC